MNIQIFGKSKCFDTKKAERWFKERRVKYQYIDLPKKGFSLGFEGDHEDILWSHDLVDRLLEDYEFLLPYYLYMLSLEGDRDPRN